MKVILSAAVSLDGCIDDCAPERLKLSGPEDWAAVQELRGRCDAILVGAGTVRRDNPSLVIRDEAVRRMRVATGLAEDIAKVTVTATGRIDPGADFFTQGEGKKYVFASGSADDGALEKLTDRAHIIRADKITPGFIEEALSAMGYRTLLVEGGSSILTMFFEAGVVDTFRLAVAPFFVGDENAPRLVCRGNFIWDKTNRMYPSGVEMLGDTAVMTYDFKR